MNTVLRAYMIEGPVEIPTNRLLFWPDNPRLKISDFKEIKYSDKELVRRKSQQRVFELLVEHEHSVDHLVRSMFKVGFMREKAPIVMEVEGTQKYLVLEGNRRLAAIRALLSGNYDGLSEKNRESLLRVPCWVFVHSSKAIPLKAAISRMVAEQHLKGQKAHTKIQQGHMLYEAYMGFLMEESGSSAFSKECDVIQRSADFFDIGYDEMELELAVVRLYKQLTLAGYEISHKIRERLTWIYKNPRHFKKNFGYQEDGFQLDGPGLDRYRDIFIGEACAVRSPARFKRFLNIMRYGQSSHIEVLRAEPELLADMEQEVKDDKADQRFLIELERIEKKLKGLKMGDYRSSGREDLLIGSISELVDYKLKRLAGIDCEEEAGRGGRNGYAKTPKDVGEALLLSYDFLSEEIMAVLDERGGGTCVRTAIPGRLLERWGVATRGKPRKAFCRFVEDSVDRMQDEDLLMDG